MMSIAIRTDSIRSRSQAIVVITADFARAGATGGVDSCDSASGSLIPHTWHKALSLAYRRSAGTCKGILNPEGLHSLRRSKRQLGSVQSAYSFTGATRADVPHGTSLLRLIRPGNRVVPSTSRRAWRYRHELRAVPLKRRARQPQRRSSLLRRDAALRQRSVQKPPWGCLLCAWFWQFLRLQGPVSETRLRSILLPACVIVYFYFLWTAWRYFNPASDIFRTKCLIMLVSEINRLARLYTKEADAFKKQVEARGTMGGRIRLSARCPCARACRSSALPQPTVESRQRLHSVPCRQALACQFSRARCG